MEESERERELVRMLGKGAIDKKGYDERRRQYIEDLAREKKIDAYRRLETFLRCMCCCPCANLCFKDEGDKWKRRFCASSLTCLLYGGITTLLSSGVIPRFSSSCLGLKIGIPVSVLGCLCATVFAKSALVLGRRNNSRLPLLLRWAELSTPSRGQSAASVLMTMKITPRMIRFCSVLPPVGWNSFN